MSNPRPIGHSWPQAGADRPQKAVLRRPTAALSRFGTALGATTVIVSALYGVTATTAGPAGASATNLIVMPSPDGPFTDDFNPYDSASSPTGDGAVSMIYEPLLMINDLKPNDVIPWLASSYSWSNGGKTITFNLHPNVKWSDGVPFTSADVAFTYEMLKKYPAINTSDIDPTSVTTPTKTKVVLNFSSPQYVNLLNIGNQVDIVPQHIWSKINPITYTDPQPVGTGPYTLSKFSPQSFTLVKNPNYWQPGLPKVATLEYPGYDSNTAALGAFSSADWSSLFEPDVQKLYVAPGGGNNHYWFPPVSDVALIPNLHNYPLNLSPVRGAISLALNRSLIDKDGEDGYEPPVTNLAGVIPGQSSYIDKSIKGIVPTQNVKEAKSLLKGAGLKMGSNGYFESPSGKPINLNFVVPAAFTDWVADSSVIAPELKAIGLDTTVNATAVNSWTSDGASGKFDLTLNGSAAGPSPYYMYNGWLNSAFTAPIGQTAASNWERFTSPQADSLLATFAGTDNAATQQSALNGLESIMVNQLPFIPLVYNVAWFEYSTKLVTGWPTAANPYMVPAGYDKPGDELVVLHLTPR
jgi:peptide/nickel transport system substrate-binding protein